MIPVEEARARILAAAQRTATEWVPLEGALGRALAAPVTARVTQPPTDVSAMDGYAVRAQDGLLSARLTQIGASAAGHAFAGSLKPGEAVRIFTGAPVPAGADAVVIQEDAEDLGGGTVIIREAASLGRHIRSAGSDFKKNDVLLAAGRRLDSPAIALAASAGHTALQVCRKPRVAILATGDELVRPGDTPGPAQIISSNSAGLAAFVRAAGGEPLDLGIAPDQIEAIASHIQSALTSADIIITIGGASVGDHDLVRPAFTRVGIALDFWKIAMRPGKPLMFGRHPSGALICGLPGNPVSALVCALLFVRPLILAMQGLAWDLPEIMVSLKGDLPTNGVREDYIRARLTVDQGRPAVEPFPVQDSSMLQILAQSDALIRRLPKATPASAGEALAVIPLRGLW